MKLIANVDVLGKALTAAIAFRSSKATMPVLSNVRLSADFGALVISATNLAASATISMPCQVKEAGVTTVNAERLAKTIDALATEFVNIETDKDGTNLVITCTGYKGKIPTIDANEFPTIQEAMPPDAFAVPTAQFASALNAVTRSASKDESRPTLTGIEFTVTEDCIQMAATDGFRLTTVKVPVQTGKTGKTTLIIPAKNLDQIARIAKGGAEEMHIAFTANMFSAAIKAGDESGMTALISSGLLDAQYPNYHAIIPKGHKTRVALSAAKLATATRLALLSAPKANTIAFNFSKAQLALIAASDNGATDASVDVQMEGAPLTMSFNGNYILDVLAGISEDAVMVEMTDPTKPAAIYAFATGKDAHLNVVMPMHPGK